MALSEEISNLLGKSLKLVTKELERTAHKNVKIQVQKFRKFIFKQTFILLFFLIASLCLFMAIIFAGIEYLQLTKTLTLLIVGFIALFIGLILKALN